jgi:malonyl-CoA O-methyltransferase
MRATPARWTFIFPPEPGMHEPPDRNDYWLAPRLVRRQFSRVSRDYDGAAVVIAELRNRLLERLDLVKLTPNRVLDVGAGTGTGARALKDRYPKAQVIALDSAVDMLVQASTRRGWWRKFDLLCADAATLSLRGDEIDLVFSHLTLPWCNSLDAVLAEVARVLRPGGLVMFTSLGPDTARELRTLWARLDPAVHVHAFLDMHDVGDALVRAGFADPVMDVERLTVTYASFDALLAELRQLGLTNLAAGRPRSLGSKLKSQALRSGYEALNEGGALPLTVEVVYGHAWVTERRSRQTETNGEVRIPLARIGRRR